VLLFDLMKEVAEKLPPEDRQPYAHVAEVLARLPGEPDDYLSWCAVGLEVYRITNGSALGLRLFDIWNQQLRGRRYDTKKLWANPEAAAIALMADRYPAHVHEAHPTWQ
jgi:hypothetical protein